MKGRYKNFEQDEYKANDARAKDAVCQFISKVPGRMISPPKEDYGPDILVYDQTKDSWRYHEVEVKLVWVGPWPMDRWSTIHLPERKGKLMEYGDISFWVLSKDLSQAWVTKDCVVKKSPLEEIPNTKIANGELFYNIPISCSYFVDLTERGSR